MSNPTRQEIIEALDALERLEHAACRGGADWHSELWRNRVIKVIPAPPQPTMAEVKWDDDKHFLAEAEHVTLGKVVMLHPAPETRIRCLCKWYGPHWVYNLTPAHLTLSGKRYTLTEVQDG